MRIFAYKFENLQRGLGTSIQTYDHYKAARHLATNTYFLIKIASVGSKSEQRF